MKIFCAITLAFLFCMVGLALRSAPHAIRVSGTGDTNVMECFRAARMAILQRQVSRLEATGYWQLASKEARSARLPFVAATLLLQIDEWLSQRPDRELPELIEVYDHHNALSTSAREELLQFEEGLHQGLLNVLRSRFPVSDKPSSWKTKAAQVPRSGSLKCCNSVLI